MSFWAARGHHPHRRQAARRGRRRAACCRPARTARPSWSRATSTSIYSYNAAESYTLAIAVLADRLAGGPGIVTPWPTDDPGLSRAERRELQALLTKQRLRRRPARRRDRGQDQGGDRRLRAEAGHDRGRPGVGQGAGGAEEVGAVQRRTVRGAMGGYGMRSKIVGRMARSIEADRDGHGDCSPSGLSGRCSTSNTGRPRSTSPGKDSTKWMRPSAPAGPKSSMTVRTNSNSPVT